MSEYPRTHSDIQCDECLGYFTLDGDLIAHREAEHAEKPTTIMRGVVSGGRFEPTSDWEQL